MCVIALKNIFNYCTVENRNDSVSLHGYVRYVILLADVTTTVAGCGN